MRFCISCDYVSSLLLCRIDTGFHWVNWPVEYEQKCQCTQVLRQSLHRHCLLPLTLAGLCDRLGKGTLPALCHFFSVGPGMRNGSQLDLTHGLEPSQPHCSLR